MYSRRSEHLSTILSQKVKSILLLGNPPLPQAPFEGLDLLSTGSFGNSRFDPGLFFRRHQSSGFPTWPSRRCSPSSARFVDDRCRSRLCSACRDGACNLGCEGRFEFVGGQEECSGMGTFPFTDSNKVQDSKSFASPHHPFTIVLSFSYWVAEKAEVGEVPHVLQWL